MNYRWCRTILAGSFVVLWAATAAAQQQNAVGQQGSWNVEFGSGAAVTTGDIDDRLTNGWNIDLGAGYEVNRVLEWDGHFTYNGLGVSDRVLQSLQVPDGRASLMSLTVGPKINFPLANRVRGYVTGGLGWYRRTVEFMEPTLGVIDIIDPWWGYLGSAVVPANQILGSVSDNAFGFNAGGGVSVGLGQSGAQVFAELRYHFADTNPTSTSIVPITFGIRFAPGR